LTRKTITVDDFDTKDIDTEKERAYQIDILTNTKIGKDTFFTKGTVNLRHKNYMDMVGSKVKIPFKIWVKNSKKVYEETGEKGNWEDLPSAS